MDKVSFIHLDDEDGLVLSFSFDEETKYGVDGYCIQRNPEFEFCLDEHEKGPTVEWTEDDRKILVRSVTFDRRVITIESDYGTERFDLSRLPDESIDHMTAMFRKMNFDHRFKLNDNREKIDLKL